MSRWILERETVTTGPFQLAKPAPLRRAYPPLYKT